MAVSEHAGTRSRRPCPLREAAAILRLPERDVAEMMAAGSLPGYRGDDGAVYILLPVGRNGTSLEEASQGTREHPPEQPAASARASGPPAEGAAATRNPEPGNPEPGNPEPGNPGPGDPEPEDPAPENPAPASAPPGNPGREAVSTAPGGALPLVEAVMSGQEPWRELLRDQDERSGRTVERVLHLAEALAGHLAEARARSEATPAGDALAARISDLEARVEDHEQDMKRLAQGLRIVRDYLERDIKSRRRRKAGAGLFRR